MDRREFIKISVGITGAIAVNPVSAIEASEPNVFSLESFVGRTISYVKKGKTCYYHFAAHHADGTASDAQAAYYVLRLADNEIVESRKATPTKGIHWDVGVPWQIAIDTGEYAEGFYSVFAMAPISGVDVFSNIGNFRVV